MHVILAVEANAGLVMIPIVAAMFVFSWRRLSRKSREQDETGKGN